MLYALLGRYQREGEAFLEGTQVWSMLGVRLHLHRRRAPRAVPRMQGARLEI